MRIKGPLQYVLQFITQDTSILLIPPLLKTSCIKVLRDIENTARKKNLTTYDENILLFFFKVALFDVTVSE